MSNQNSNFNTTQLPGGVTRVSSGSPVAPESASFSGSQIAGRYTAGSDKVESFTTRQANTSSLLDEARANADGSIAATARTPWGSVASQINDESIVSIGGMETNAATAAKMGLLKRDAQGNYSDSQGSNQAQQQAPVAAPVADTDDAVQIHPEALAGINGAIADLPQSIYENAVAKVISSGMDSLDMNRLGEYMETDPADARARMEFVVANYKAAADIAVRGIVGKDSSEFFDWAGTEAGEAGKQAMLQMVLGGSTAAMKALASTWVKATNPSDAALNQGGFETKTERDGTRMIKVSGTWTSLAAAVRNGWV